MSWKEAKRTLRKDARSEVTEILQKEEKEKMFTEHIEKLTLKKKSKFRYFFYHLLQENNIFEMIFFFFFFRDLLDEIGELSLTISWKKIRSQIKDDPRYAKFSSSDRVRNCVIFSLFQWEMF